MTLTPIVIASSASFLIVIAAWVVPMMIRRAKNARASAYTNEQIYVGNLPYQVDEKDLTEYFSQFGSIEMLKVVRNFKTGGSKGYAFITYNDATEATKALAAHGQELKGRTMVVRIAKPRQQHAF